MERKHFTPNRNRKKVNLVVHFLATKYPKFGLNFTLIFLKSQLRICTMHQDLYYYYYVETLCSFHYGTTVMDLLSSLLIIPIPVSLGKAINIFYRITK